MLSALLLVGSTRMIARAMRVQGLVFSCVEVMHESMSDVSIDVVDANERSRRLPVKL